RNDRGENSVRTWRAGHGDAAGDAALAKRPASRFIWRCRAAHHDWRGVSLRYGRLNDHALSPCVAAYRMREPGTMVRPGTSTIGRPLPATTHVVVPFGSLITPKSEAA